MKIVSLFSGIGAFEKALKNLDIQYDLAGFSEIDKYAIKSYCAIHGEDESKNLGDISKVDETTLPKDIDLITYGFPCQDISLAGKQKGLFNEDGTQTRSGLFFEALRIIEATQPKVAIAENVKNLTGKTFKEQFEIVLNSLESAGYNNYWKVLNAKDFGIPQNRERVFIVSIRKDIDTGRFEFPKGFPLELRLKDMLEDKVDEKYYLSDKMVDYLYDITDKNKARGNGNVYKPSDVEGLAKTITTREWQRVKDNFIEEIKVNQVGQLYGTEKEPNPSGGRVYSENGLMRTLGLGHGMSQPIVAVTSQQPKIQVIGNYSPSGMMLPEFVDVNGIAPTVKENHGTVTAVVQKIGNIYPSGGQNGNIYNGDGISPTILSGTTNTKGNGGIESSNAPKVMQNNLRIRKLTPKECWRLMGFDDSDYGKAEKVNSNTQLYKQAGNSIVVDVLEHLFKQLLECEVLDIERN